MSAKKRQRPSRSKKSRRRPGSLLVRHGHLLSPNADDPNGKLDLLIEQGKIVDVAEKISARGIERVVDANHLLVLPGLVQTHTHAWHSIFRAHSAGLDALSWWREIVWPIEGALDEETMRAAARLGLAELLLSGTTCVLDVGPVRFTEILFEEAKRLGIRYIGGKTVMDHGHGYPAALRESTEEALAESIRLCKQWHRAEQDRLRYAFSPLRVLTCTGTALSACARAARATDALLHVCAAESAEEVALVRERTGGGEVELLHRLGCLGPMTVLAHGIWLSTSERKIIRESRATIAHCPSANSRRGAGIARVCELLEEGIEIGLGCDSAGSTGTLDVFAEMRLAALLQKMRAGAAAMPATALLSMATLGGARALGYGDIGALAPGNRADLVLLDLRSLSTGTGSTDLASRIIYGARGADVHTVIVDGRIVVDEGKLQGADYARTLASAQRATEALNARVGG